MDIIIDLKKSIEENAAAYFDRAKKLRKKADGAKLAFEKAKSKMVVLQDKEARAAERKLKEAEAKEKKTAAKRWYHNFRWFISSDDFLVIGGRDATTNEIVIKKHTDSTDIVFHTEMPASPFVVIKSEGKKIPDSTIKEAAQFTASYSSAWKRGIASAEVFHVTPEQVTKEAKSGEFVAKGAFMIYGKKHFLTCDMKLALGRNDTEVMAGPLSAVKKRCEKFVEVLQGDEKNSDVAKKIQKKIGGDLDEIIKVLPQGCRVK